MKDLMGSEYRSFYDENPDLRQKVRDIQEKDKELVEHKRPEQIEDPRELYKAEFDPFRGRITGYKEKLKIQLIEEGIDV